MLSCVTFTFSVAASIEYTPKATGICQEMLTFEKRHQRALIWVLGEQHCYASYKAIQLL